jgi:putative oxidoreductase
MFSVDVGLFILRAVVGLLFVGHGAQKLFGWFGGHGMASHIEMTRRLNVHPAVPWAWASALTEFLGGLAFALGILTPIVAAALIGNMLVAIIRVHWQHGLWNQDRGIEYPMTLAFVSFVVGGVGAGVYSLDHLFNIELAEPATYLMMLGISLLAVIVAVAAPLIFQPHPPAQQIR